MANKRIKDFGNTSTDPIRDDCYIAIDSTADGSEKVTINNLLGGTKCKIVTKESDFPAAVGSTITLAADTCYLLRGDISTANQIDPNGSTLMGADVRTTSLTYTASSGALFTGDNSGLISEITLLATGGGTAQVFDMDASIPADGILEISRVAISSSDVGKIEGYVFLRMENVTYQSNSTGLELEDITVLEIRGERWSSNNTATTNITFTGTFSRLFVQSGLYDVATSKTQFALAGITSLTSGLIEGFLAPGAGTLYSGSVPANLSIFGKGSGTTVVRVNYT